MSKNLLIIGNTNLPVEKGVYATAAGLRTWHFLKPILKYTDYKVYCFLISLGEKENYDIKKITVDDLYLEGIDEQVFMKCDMIAVNKHKTSLKDELKKYLKYVSPDMAISINTYPSYIASKYIPRNIPLWCDLNGWIIAEAVSQARVLKNDSFLNVYYRWEHDIVKRADKFSTVSLPQKYALYGELADKGRCSHLTDDYDFVSVVQNACDKDNFKIIEGDVDMEKINWKLKDLLNKKEKYILLQNGKYNSWLDVDTLFTGIEKAIEKNNNIYFASTMGGIQGYDMYTFSRFKELVSKSKYSDHYILFDGLTSYELEVLYKNATLGINIDKPNIESRFGARNRINELMIHKVPVITTLNTEISYDFKINALGIVIDPSNADLFSDEIVKCVVDVQRLNIYKDKAYEFCLNKYNYDITTKDVIQWLKNTTKSPDWKYSFDISKKRVLSMIWINIKKFGIKDLFRKIMRKIRH